MTVAIDKAIICPILIGRTRELVALYSLIDVDRSEPDQAALISGEAGIGKSRLVAEARSYAVAQGFLPLQGSCFQADTSYPYAPLLDLLRAFFANQISVSLTANQEQIVNELVRLLPDLAFLFPHHVPLPQPQTLDPEQQKRRLFIVLTHFFTTLAAQQPALLIVEDIQWCDESSLDFLLHLARHCSSQPLFLLFTYRSEEISPGLSHWLAQLDREHLALELVLKPLSRIEVDAMLQAIFTLPHPIPTELLETVYTLTEGNPFFVEEMLKSLITTGELQFADGKWEFRSEKRDSEAFSFIPRSVHDAVKQRADQLSTEAKQALTLASVAGRRFDFTLLQTILHCDEDQLLPLMKELIAAQLVVEESADQFAFRHALIRQAIYSELLARERRSLHSTIAEALESLHASPSRREVYLVDLAYHFYEAGAWSKALEYQVRAGERALALYAPRTAIEYFTHALDAAYQLPVTPPSKLYYARGQAYETLGEFDRARSDYERALDIAHKALDGSMEWQSMMALGFLWAERDYAQTGAWFRRSLDLAERLADPTLRARSLNRLGNWLVNTGRIEEGLQAHQTALRIFEEQHNTQGMAETLDLLGITYGMRGERVKAVEQLKQAIALFRTLGDTQSLLSSLAMRAVQSMPGSSETTLCPLRTRDECVQDAAEALLLARQIDSLAGQAFAENTLAHTLLSFGEFGPALSHAQEANRIAREIEHQQWMVAASYALGQVYMLLLAPALAISSLEDGLSLARELGSTFWISTIAAHLGRAYVLNHDLPAAKAILQSVNPVEQSPRTIEERDIALAWGEFLLAQREPDMALQIAEQLLASAPGLMLDQSIQPIPHLLKLKGEALIALSHLDEAVEALEDARRGAQERNARPVLWTIHRSLGQAYQLLQRKDQARQEYVAGRQLVEELAMTIDDTSLRDQFERAALDSFPQQKLQLPRKTVRHAFGGLTAREREVATLVAQGKTSREIADLLVISERTAEGHVRNILGKLGFTSRAQIAVWVVEKGLAKH
jgi:DNA-binding NarL/FixJ family response regulator/Tfp pilus assembly protein PilF